MENTYTLKPCPFCGSPAELDDISTEDEEYYMIACINPDCGAAASFGDKSETKQGAVDAWNKRKED